MSQCFRTAHKLTGFSVKGTGLVGLGIARGERTRKSMNQLGGYEEITTCGICGKDDFTQLTNAQNVNFYQCNNCLVIFLNPRPKFDTLREQYTMQEPVEAWFNHKKTYLRNLQRERLDDVLRYVDSGDLLDIGCGMGDFCGVALEAGFKVFGTEISDDYTEYNERTVGLAEMFVGRLQEINFSNRKFDVICLWHVLEHLPDPLV